MVARARNVNLFSVLFFGAFAQVLSFIGSTNCVKLSFLHTVRLRDTFLSEAKGELPRFRSKMFIPDSLKKRIKDGTLSVYELDRIFNPNEKHLNRMLHPLASGFVGAIFSLESSLLDINHVYAYTLAVLADDLHQDIPDPKLVNDLVGSPFRDILVGLGWPSPRDPLVMKELEHHFYSLLDFVMDKLPVPPRPGARELLDSLIKFDNQVSVKTSMPREVALKALRLSRLSALFEGRVDAQHLITASGPLQSDAAHSNTSGGVNSGAVGASSDVEVEAPIRAPPFGDKFVQAQLVRCCAVMESPSVLAVLVDANRHSVVCAKRCGLSCIALSGSALNQQMLRGADRVVPSLERLRVKDIYMLVQAAIRQEAGPGLQAETAVDRVQPSRQQVAAPAMDRQIMRDTFADDIPDAEQAQDMY